jgi:hypothetical protein
MRVIRVPTCVPERRSEPFTGIVTGMPSEPSLVRVYHVEGSERVLQRRSVSHVESEPRNCRECPTKRASHYEGLYQR